MWIYAYGGENVSSGDDCNFLLRVMLLAAFGGGGYNDHDDHDGRWDFLHMELFNTFPYTLVDRYDWKIYGIEVFE